MLRIAPVSARGE